MPGARFLVRVLALLLCLLSSLQRVSTNQVSGEVRDLCSNTYGAIGVSPSLSDLNRNCPMGFTCCESGCCPEKKNIWNFSNNDLRILFIVSRVMLPLLFICVLVILNTEEPPPPYSLRPEDPAGQMRCTYSTAF
ncbi:transmembrane protein 92-like [Mesocricetus auratus]|uniref:Transmembrane protein 92-like n=1 Tax=Mesocricetus auratus TaxID=10036 RepID=A0ABM2XMA8_MESAU|nr:transmembrane protein 92-like [Mesocricetus auratus]